MEESPEKRAEKDGRLMAQYLVNEIMPTIDHADQLNCLLSSLTLVYHRMKTKNYHKPYRMLYKNDPMINYDLIRKILEALNRENEDD
jgi:chloramphenicol O-acetyltransferase